MPEFPDLLDQNLVDSWLEERPDSVTARVLELQVSLDRAWAARGGGFAKTVTDERWKQFEEKLRVAGEQLQVALQGPAAEDPHLYVVAISWVLGTGAPKAEMEKLFNAGLALQPGYLELYGAKFNFLLPRWYGSREELATFVKSAKPEVVGRLFIGQTTIRKGVNEVDLPWELVRQGLDRLQKRFPQDDEILQHRVVAACHYGDRTAAREVFKELTKERFLPQFWGSWKTAEQWRAWSEGGEDPRKSDPDAYLYP